MLLATMLTLAAAAVGSGLLAGTPAHSLDLGPWITLQLAGGSLASVAAGFLARRIAHSGRAPLILAGGAATFGVLETFVLVSATSRGDILLPVRAALAAPIVTALGVLLGGWLAGLGATRGMEPTPEARVEHRMPLRFAIVLPAVVLVAAMVVAAFGIPPSGAAVVATALTLDFTIVVPGLVYLLLVRTKYIPWTGVVPVFVGSYAIAFAMLPAEHRELLDAMALLAVPAEVGFVAYLVDRVRRAVRRPSQQQGDFASRFRAAAREAIGARLPADILTTEVAILYHALRWPLRQEPHAAQFTVHRSVGYGTVMVGLLMVLAIETVPVHLVVSGWSPVAAWILTALSIYSVVWLVGDYRAIASRPLVVTETHVQLRVGLRWEADIPRGNIAGIDRVRVDRDGAPKGTVRATLLDQPTVGIRLHEPVDVLGMYGIRRSATEILLTVDHVERFVALIDKRH